MAFGSLTGALGAGAEAQVAAAGGRLLRAAWPAPAEVPGLAALALAALASGRLPVPPIRRVPLAGAARAHAEAEAGGLGAAIVLVPDAAP